MKICIDPGHGGHDPGARGQYGLFEKDVNLRVGFRLLALCREVGFGAFLTRESDIFIPLVERGHLANENMATCFISLHCNAHINRNAWGLEVWTTKGQTASDPLAQQIALQLKKSFTEPFRAEMSDGDLDKEANYTVLVSAKCPAVLVEMGFLSHPQTEALFNRPAHLELLASTILRGIQSWSGMSSRVR